jgi:phage host-nuclease inhibitor protein Gam
VVLDCGFVLGIIKIRDRNPSIAVRAVTTGIERKIKVNERKCNLIVVLFEVY